jgi:PAS domain S-box-containing protein
MRLQNLLRRAPTIRQWLAMLLAALLVPAAVAVVALFVYSYQRERAGIERANLDVARALMQAIDRELSSAQGAMQALATSPNLDHADLRAFHGQATEVLHERPGNILLLADAHGRQVANTHVSFGVPLPLHGNQVQLRRVFETGRSLVSDLYVGPTVGRLLTSVDVPVVRNSRVLYVLSMQYFGERLGAILERQNIPPDATATIYDSTARIVWRSRGSSGDVGRRASAALAGGMLLEPEGIVDENGTDGVPHVTVFSRSTMSNWAVAIALRRSVLNAALSRSMAWIALGALGMFALGLALVRAIGARIERSVGGLVKSAIALGYGEPVALPDLHLREAKDVGHALVQAAALLRERTAQRDDAERASQEIERSEAFLRGIFEETPDGVLLVGRDCRIMRANAQAEQLFGHAQGALAGLAIDGLLVESGPAPRPVCERVWAAPLRCGLDGATQLYGRRRDGSRFPVDAMTSPLRGGTLVILTVRDMTDNWEQDEALRRTLEDKNILLKELYHRVKNNLQLIISMFNLQVRSLSDSEARQALIEAAARVRTMALVHERLYQSPTLSSIALDAYLTELCEQLAGAALAAQRGIAVQVDAEPVEIGLDLAVPLGLILNELVSNSLKHAFPDGRRGRIQVRVVRDPDTERGDAMRLSVEDDGIGLPPDFDRTSTRTLGLRLVSALSEQLRGSFSILNPAPERRGGVLASLVFSLPGAAASSARRHEAALPD